MLNSTDTASFPGLAGRRHRRHDKDGADKHGPNRHEVSTASSQAFLLVAEVRSFTRAAETRTSPRRA